MTQYRDMRSFRVSDVVQQGMALGVEPSGRVAFACAPNDIPRCPIEGLIWSLNVEDYNGIRTLMYQRHGNPPDDTEKF